MVKFRAQPGEVIDVRPLGAELATTKTYTLFQSDLIEVIRLVMAAGKSLSQHKVPSAITIHCLEGKIAFAALGRTQELAAGQMLFLEADEPHAVQCLEDSSFLLTLVRQP